MDRNDEAIDRSLQNVYRVEPPQHLHDRLLAIADAAPAARKERVRRRSWFSWPFFFGSPSFQWRLAAPACAVAAAVAVMWIAGYRIAPQETPMDGQDVAQREAVRDFIIVMNYLHSATASAHRGVQAEIGSGLMTALDRGERSFNELSNEIANGG